MLDELARFERWLRWMRPRWMLDAACREHPELTWFPGKGEQAGPAKAVCRDCLVREECAEFATGREMFGVWGGLSPLERGTRVSPRLVREKSAG